MTTRVYECQFVGGSRDGQIRRLMGFWSGYPIKILRDYRTGERWRRREIARGFGIAFVYELEAER